MGKQQVGRHVCVCRRKSGARCREKIKHQTMSLLLHKMIFTCPIFFLSLLLLEAINGRPWTVQILN